MELTCLTFMNLLFVVQCFYIKPDSDSQHNSTAEEVQNAICTITTKEFEASANATISRQLKGVCSSGELRLKLAELETHLSESLDEIKRMLQQKRLYTNQTETNNVFASEEDNSVVSLIDEINLKNDSIEPSTNGNVYIYYWRIPKVRELLTKSNMYQSSAEFYVLGHTLHLQLFPNLPEEGYLSLQLGRSSNGFLKKHKLYILNQLYPNRIIRSQVLYGFKGANMFTVKTSMVEEEGYCLDNSVVVKLEIFLNS